LSIFLREKSVAIHAHTISPRGNIRERERAVIASSDATHAARAGTQLLAILRLAGLPGLILLLPALLALLSLLLAWCDLSRATLRAIPLAAATGIRHQCHRSLPNGLSRTRLCDRARDFGLGLLGSQVRSLRSGLLLLGA
jgi:hypothetical protein